MKRIITPGEDMPSASDRIETARAAYEELRSFLDGMPPLRWSKTSMCKGWEVRDVVAHLVHALKYQAKMVQLGVKGVPRPADIFEGVTQEMRTRAIAREARLQSEKLADQLLPAFTNGYRKIFDLFSSLTEEELNKRTFHAIGPGGVVKVRTYIDLVVLETTLHSWDIRYALDPSARLTPASVPVLMGYASAWLRRTLHPKARNGEALRYRLRVGDWPETISDILVQGDDFSRVEPVSPEVTATLTCDVDSFLLLHFGRFGFLQAIESGRLEAEGDVEAVRLLDAWTRPV